MPDACGFRLNHQATTSLAISSTTSRVNSISDLAQRGPSLCGKNPVPVALHVANHELSTLFSVLAATAWQNLCESRVFLRHSSQGPG